MRLNIDRDLVKQLVSGQLPNKSRHLDELTHEPSIWQCDTGQWLSCFDSYQLTILWMANVKDVDLPRHAWDTPPFLLIVSPTLPVQSVDAYTRSVTWQPNEKRLNIFYEYGALSHARFVGEGAPTRNCSVQWAAAKECLVKAYITNEIVSKTLLFLQSDKRQDFAWNRHRSRQQPEWNIVHKL